MKKGDLVINWMNLPPAPASVMELDVATQLRSSPSSMTTSNSTPRATASDDIVTVDYKLKSTNPIDIVSVDYELNSTNQIPLFCFYNTERSRPERANSEGGP